MVSDPVDALGTVSEAKTPLEPLGTPPEAIEPTAVTLTDEQKAELAEEYLKGRDDGWWAKHPYVNTKTSQFVNREKRRMETEAQKRQQEVQEAQAFFQQFNSLTEERQAAALRDRRVRSDYDRAEEILAQGSGIPLTSERAAKNIYDAVKASVVSDERFADTPFDELAEDAADMPELVSRVLDHGFKKRERAMETELDKKMAAMEARLRAEMHRAAERPERTTPGGEATTGLTLEKYAAMTSDEREELRTKSPQLIDALSR